jgi:very-short-patch-repair endonuclease
MFKTPQKIARHKVVPEDYERARRLRREMPRNERILWRCLRELPEELGVTFRRQQPIHPYIADFACMAIKLVIELDGESHDTRQEKDKQRDIYLRRLGYVTLRFNNNEVSNNFDGVVQTIIVEINKLKGVICD